MINLTYKFHQQRKTCLYDRITPR